MRFVVTGTPGAGTRWVANVYSRAGVDTGHESVFHHGRPDGGLRIQPARHQAEVSWYAAPWLAHLAMPAAHQTRHPLDTIGTIVAMGDRWFTNPNHHGTLTRLAPTIYDHPPGVARATAFWLVWTGYADAAPVRWQAEAPDPAVLAGVARAAGLPVEAADVARALAETPPTGRRNRQPRLTWDDLGGLAGDVADRAAGYGYH